MSYIFGQLCTCTQRCLCGETCQCSDEYCNCAISCNCPPYCGCDGGRKIGAGIYSDVYSFTSGGILRAAKVPNSEAIAILPKTGLTHAILVDCDVMSRLRHPHLQSCTIGRHKSTLAMIMPLAQTDMHNAVYIQRQPYTLSKALDTIYKLASAYSFLHQQGILHLDPKFSNNLLTSDGTPILTDFSLSGYTDDPLKPMPFNYIAYAMLYRPPEFFENRYVTYSAATEMWAFGINMLMFMMTVVRREPRAWLFDFNDKVKVHTFIRKYLTKDTIVSSLEEWLREPVIDDIRPLLTPTMDEVIKLLTRMLDWDPDSRLTMAELLVHPAFGSEHKAILGTVITPERSSHTTVTTEQIKTMINVLKTTFPYATSEMLFLAVDLLYRITNPTHVRLVACAWLGYKLIAVSSLSNCADETKLLVTSLDDRYMLQHLIAAEQDIVLELKGRLYPPHIYALCKTRAHLEAALVYLLDPVKYLTLVGQELTTWISHQPIAAATQPKHMLLAHLI